MCLSLMQSSEGTSYLSYAHIIYHIARSIKFGGLTLGPGHYGGF